MTKFEKERKQLRKYIEWLSKSKKRSLNFLVDAGILTPTGRLTKRYK